MIQHKGIILSINKNIAEISIQQTSACVSCQVKGSCLSVDTKERRITANITPENYEVGEEVQVTLKTTQGYKAVFIAYVIPFILIIAVLVLGETLGLAEWKSAVAAICVTVLYYIALKLFGKQLSQSMTFKIEKLNNI
ncbi:MAG: SoxR reducing system RseC family protein [Salinivirgaceae bacterium]|jgi:positive regulator of sigma E activity|nr:SoxR reducing system RseC family protein [Bacteroidales bacterium]